MINLAFALSLALPTLSEPPTADALNAAAGAYLVSVRAWLSANPPAPEVNLGLDPKKSEEARAEYVRRNNAWWREISAAVADGLDDKLERALAVRKKVVVVMAEERNRKESAERSAGSRKAAAEAQAANLSR